MSDHSDDEGSNRNGGDDVALPKATVNKFANEVVADIDMRLGLETRELLTHCCSEFVQLLSSEANEVCEKDQKKTITGEHVLRAMEELGFQRYYDEVSDEHQRMSKSGERGRRKGFNAIIKESGLSKEELIRQQNELFQMARSDPVMASKVYDKRVDPSDGPK